MSMYDERLDPTGEAADAADHAHRDMEHGRLGRLEREARELGLDFEPERYDPIALEDAVRAARGGAQTSSQDNCPRSEDESRSRRGASLSRRDTLAVDGRQT